MKKLIIFLLMCGICLASPTGIVAHWKLNDNAATDVVVDSAGSNNGALVNGNNDITSENSVTGVVKTALSFNGADDKITVPADPSIDVFGKTALTVSAWIFPNSSGRIVDKTDSSTNGYNFFVGGGGITLIALINHATTDTQAIKTNIVTVGAWNHVVFVYNEDGAKKIKLYLNGILQSLSSDTAGVGAIKDDSSSVLNIGADRNGGNNFTGNIDNVKILDKALTVHEIRLLYRNGNGTEIIAEMDTSRRYGRRNRTRYTK